MSVSKEDVIKVAHLARIRINENEVEEMQSKLNDILNFVDQLNEVDCSSIGDDVEYITSLHERDDIPIKTDRQGVMSNAAKSEYDMFVVPKVVE